MAAPVITIVEGTTSDLRFQLLQDGLPIDLTGVTVALLLADRTGAPVSSPGTISMVDESEGKVQLVPSSTGVFVASKGPYHARWELTDGSGKVSYVPSSARDVWNIVGV